MPVAGVGVCQMVERAMIRALTKGPPPRIAVDMPEEPKRAHAVKNTKRWCRGKVGAEHVEQWRPGDGYSRPKLGCSRCGKLLDWNWDGDLLLKRIEARIAASGPDDRAMLASALMDMVKWLATTSLYVFTDPRGRYPEPIARGPLLLKVYAALQPTRGAR